MRQANAICNIIQEALDKSDNVLSIPQLCQAAGLPVQTFYSWRRAAGTRSRREAQDEKDFAIILSAAYSYNGKAINGGPQIYMELLHRDPEHPMNLKKIYRLMRKYGLRSTFRKPNPNKQLAAQMKTHHRFKNILEQNFRCYGPRRVFLTDITYIPFQDCFIYLSAIMDSFTKEIVAYKVSESLAIDFVRDTVIMLLKNHRNEIADDAIMHSDQGCHYTSNTFIEMMEDAHITQSMSKKGYCWDNAPQESFWGHMKDVLDLSACITFSDAAREIDKFMNYYNNRRYQMNLNRLSPREYFQFCVTGKYPLNVKNPPAAPKVEPPKEGTNLIWNSVKDYIVSTDEEDNCSGV
ncbi:MAG: IS3 family transposase [Prevotella sp.]|nr:IS3 family transposase [Prevotella sp.]